jgi:hypothetical protein
MAEILCSVESCIHNQKEEHKCSLHRIQVIPAPDLSSGTVEESNCGSFEKRSKVIS